MAKVQCADVEIDVSSGSGASVHADKRIDAEAVRFKLDKPDTAGIIEPIEQEEGEEYFSLLMPLKLSD